MGPGPGPGGDHDGQGAECACGPGDRAAGPVRRKLRGRGRWHRRAEPSGHGVAGTVRRCRRAGPGNRLGAGRRPGRGPVDMTSGAPAARSRGRHPRSTPASRPSRPCAACPHGRPRGAGGDRRPVGLGQVHAAARDGDARPAKQRRRADQRGGCGHAERRRAVLAAGDPDRLRLPAVLPGRARHGARERRRRAPLRRRPPRRALPARRRRAGTGRPGRAPHVVRPSSPAGSASASRSPGLSSGARDRPRRRADRQPRQPTGASILELIHELNTAGSTIILITHDDAIADRLARQIGILDGQIVADTDLAASGRRSPPPTGAPAGADMTAGRQRRAARADAARGTVRARDRDRNGGDRRRPRAVRLLAGRAARGDQPARHEPAHRQHGQSLTGGRRSCPAAPGHDQPDRRVQQVETPGW